MAYKFDYTSRGSLFVAFFWMFTFTYFINGHFSFWVTFYGTLIVLNTMAWQTMMFIKFNIINRFLKRVDPTNKSVFITGCDSGFGHMIALRFNEYGFKVYAGCLTVKGEGAKSLVSKASDKTRMIPLQLDVTKDNEIKDCLSKVKESIKQSNDTEEFWALVNNAGIAPPGAVEWGNFKDHFVNTMDINALSQVNITRHFLPLIRKSHGRVVCMASVTSRLTTRFIAAYSMSKHAVIGFADCLREEVEGRFGVKVITIEPFFYQTDMTRSDNIDSLLQRNHDSTDEEVKKAYGVDKGIKHFSIHKLLSLPLIGTSTNVKEVINDVEAAVVDHEPKLRYTPNPLFMKGIVLMAQIMPRYLLQKVHIDNAVNFIRGKKKQ